LTTNNCNGIERVAMVPAIGRRRVTLQQTLESAPGAELVGGTVQARERSSIAEAAATGISCGVSARKCHEEDSSSGEKIAEMRSVVYKPLGAATPGGEVSCSGF
jgi:hypothetical protein